ncbi:hypothetical protein BDK51DRAFT_38345 [Blyttiomyces helicus]|uniref:F-box domain-containing protein n=1 Tax=Blyttiomyces helicus TaxID=388810 RepID=A0A4P9W6K6_9FUNG|nr:hypothetical protein BDK51DRAFT_38345 [Blyttiomyces helicus]|eukprot:RKO87003.1 hypothetical protein BDK51DRAFT_38345 [Blyttiomyces helicus]
MAVPHLEANTLPHLKVAEVHGICYSRFLLRSLTANRPPLRRLALGHELGKSLRNFATLLRACPSITHLDLSSAREISDATLAVLKDHPPRTTLRLHAHLFDPSGRRLRQATFTTNGLQRLLKVRGSNLKLLDIADNLLINYDLLACIACLSRTSPLLEILHLGYRERGRAMSVADVAFISDLKRGYPKLRNVGLGTWLQS